jgi:hypothetical protein
VTSASIMGPDRSSPSLAVPEHQGKKKTHPAHFVLYRCGLKETAGGRLFAQTSRMLWKTLWMRALKDANVVAPSPIPDSRLQRRDCNVWQFL